MKKYDLYIAGTYVTIILIAFISIFYSYKSHEEARDLFDSPPISKVEINDYKGDMLVVTVDKVPENREDWCAYGYIMGTDKFKLLKIEDNTLYINGSISEHLWENIHALYVKKGITVEINNSPKVVLLTYEESKKVKTITTEDPKSIEIIRGR